MIKVGVIGCGYWGPNLIRNFVSCPQTELVWACDLNENSLKGVLRPYQGVKETTDFNQILQDKDVDAVAIATPVYTHYDIAKTSLEHGKHVLVEKPLAMNVAEGKALVELAKKNELQLMCDHTYCYTGAVRKIKDIITSGDLGKVLYFDSVRVNLGLFQQDVNVVWDLAPHDLSIIDHIIDEKPEYVSVHGMSHAGNGLENIAYISLRFKSRFIAHIHVNWLSPVKVRKTMIAGSDKMLVWDDLDQAEIIKIYDKGINAKISEREKKRQFLISYRSGDMCAPRIEQTEALSLMVKEFADCIVEKRPALTDGEAGLQVLRILEASERSINADGANVRIEYSDGGTNGILSH